MNPVERVARRLDAAQQRHTPAAVVVAVAKKFTDDNGGIMAAALAHSAFVSISRCCWYSSRFLASSQRTTQRYGPR
jgi:hypothetical protein